MQKNKPAEKDQSADQEKHGAPGAGHNDDAPIYYQPESGQPGTTRDPDPRAKKEKDED